MKPLEPKQDANRESGFLSAQTNTESRSWLPWIVASAVVILVLVALAFFGRRSGPAPQLGGAGLAPAAPYAANLPISGIEMSQATSFSGAKVTYVDGKISNTGGETLTGITIDAGFRNDLGQFSLRQVMPLSFIRTREPYVDTEPVSAAPLKPGETQTFRLIFDNLPADWNEQSPEIRVIGIQGH